MIQIFVLFCKLFIFVAILSTQAVRRNAHRDDVRCVFFVDNNKFDKLIYLTVIAYTATAKLCSILFVINNEIIVQIHLLHIAQASRPARCGYTGDRRGTRYWHRFLDPYSPKRSSLS